MKPDLAFGLSFAVLVPSVLLSVLAFNFVKNKKKSPRRKVDDTSAPSSSAASTGSESYDVFLSFSGKDTRKTIVDHLYNKLVEVGIHVFKDDNELREGEEIGTNLVLAIKNSKISIPIFSENYASSKWCLQELVKMTECAKSGQIVLPIFYRVEPAHVRYQNGRFGKNFSRLSGKYLEEVVAKWKKALQEVASLKGWESDRFASGHEGELVKEVAGRVLRELKKAFQLVVTEQLVGINNVVEDILKLLDANPSATQIVGIHGMGGIGKTTLAKVVYNKLSDKFQHRSFIADVRESSQRKGISCLQDQLIFDILKTNDPVSSTDEGINIMESRFKRMKVLIFLDDVNHKDQLKALVGKSDWFEMGSRIIITTRISSVLDEAGVECMYKLKELAEDESLILLCRHAFWRDSPSCGFESLSHAVMSTTGGLPLALKVIGSYLYGKNEAFWQKALEKLRTVPHEEVQEKLKISYEALNKEEKQIFLDIACFFIGSDLKIVSYMWEASEFFPRLAIDKLSVMSLIKIEDDGKLKMHDQLRDLGRKIIRDEDYSMPINRSRLWVYEEAMEVLQRDKGNREAYVQALRLVEDYTKKDFSDSSSELERKFTTEQFETLPKLRFLEVRDAKLTGDSRSLLPLLRWLAWRRCPTVVATSFCLKKLVILDLSSSDISELWEGWSHLKRAKHLKVLDLSYCHYLKVSPDLSTFRSLEIFQLKACWILKQIHPSIGKAEKLVSLDLRDCHELQELPQEMNKLEELKELYIDRSAIVEIPPCIGSLKKLEVLSAAFCNSLVGLPDSVSHLVNLSTLDFSFCAKLCKLPENIGSLVKLEHLSWGFDYCRHRYEYGVVENFGSLNLSYGGISELPESIGDLKNLKFLHINHSEKLSNLPSTISKLGNLEELVVTSCKSLGGEIHIDGLSSLKILQLSSTGISGFHGTFDKISCLQKLMLDDCQMLQSLPELPASLTVLAVTGQHHRFPQLSHLIHLRKLTVKDCPLLKSMPELPLRLSELFVDNCGELKSMPELPSRLLELKVNNCGELEELPSLSRLELLSKLLLWSCDKLTEIRGLEGLKSLERFIVDCLKLSNLDGLEHLESLRCLRLWTSDPILKEDQVRGFEKLKNLEELIVQCCESLVRVDVSQLTHLEWLNFCGCCNLLEIKGLERLKNLTTLNLLGCPSIDTLPDLSCLHNLGFVIVDNRSNIPDFRGVRRANYLGNEFALTSVNFLRPPNFKRFIEVMGFNLA